MIRYKEGPELARTSLPLEQQLRVLQEEAAPRIARLQRWRWALLLPFVGGLAVLMGYTVPGTLLLVLGGGALLRTREDRVQWRNTRQQVRGLAVEVRGTDAVPALLDFARWQGKEAAECHMALERLLARLDLTRAQQLSSEQRAYLRHCAENQDPTVEFTVAALLVLGSAGDRQTVPIARKLAVSSSSQRIRDAAQLCLEELGATES